MTDVTVPLSGWGWLGQQAWGTDSWGEGNALPLSVPVL
jgi:hypothetical protein